MAVCACGCGQTTKEYRGKPRRYVFGHHARGTPYLTEQVIEHWCVDIFVPSINLVIFVDGCYWHGCPTHFPERTPKHKRDKSRVPYLTKCGYQVCVIWEHDVYERLETTLAPFLEKAS